jgi:membrane protease YdiL (CAAX protease family)
MWSPGVAALGTRLLYQGTLRGEGWGWGRTRWNLLAGALPLGYAAAAYGLVGLTGLGGVDPGRFDANPATFLSLGWITSLFLATGEELGWRGFLVPALVRSLPFGPTALVSGVIWLVWHLPLVLFADYNAGTPAWYAVLCFSVGVLSLSVLLAWLRLRSGSVWPAVILHGTHNLFIQGFFDRVTVSTGPTPWLTGEFGAVLALAIAGVAGIVWRARGSVDAVA